MKEKRGRAAARGFPFPIRVWMLVAPFPSEEEKSFVFFFATSVEITRRQRICWARLLEAAGLAQRLVLADYTRERPRASDVGSTESVVDGATMATQLRAVEHQTQGRAYSCLPHRLPSRAHSPASPRGMHQDAAQNNESEVVGATMPQLGHEYSPASNGTYFPPLQLLAPLRSLPRAASGHGGSTSNLGSLVRPCDSAVDRWLPICLPRGLPPPLLAPRCCARSSALAQARCDEALLFCFLRLPGPSHTPNPWSMARPYGKQTQCHAR